MKKSFNLLAIILIIVFLASCHKDENLTSIQGYVVEEGSNIRLPKKKILIYTVDAVFLGPYSESAIDTIYSDDTGHYKWELKGDNSGRSYLAKVIHPNYQITIPVGFYSGNVAKKDIIVQPKAWIRFHVKNTNPFDSNDQIKAPGALGNGSDYNFYGTMIDTAYIEKYRFFAGNQKNQIFYIVIKNNIKKIFEDSLYIKGVDTVDYQINY